MPISASVSYTHLDVHKRQGLDIKGLSDLLGSDSDILVEGLALLATSALLFAGIHANKRVKETHRRKDPSGRVITSSGRKKIHTVDAICIGVTQCLAAVFPGLSRSGSTLSVGLLRGINQQTALDYSFVLGIPSIAVSYTHLDVYKRQGLHRAE